MIFSVFLSLSLCVCLSPSLSLSGWDLKTAAAAAGLRSVSRIRTSSFHWTPTQPKSSRRGIKCVSLSQLSQLFFVLVWVGGEKKRQTEVSLMLTDKIHFFRRFTLFAVNYVRVTSAFFPSACFRSESRTASTWCPQARSLSSWLASSWRDRRWVLHCVHVLFSLSPRPLFPHIVVSRS